MHSFTLRLLLLLRQPVGETVRSDRVIAKCAARTALNRSKGANLLLHENFVRQLSRL